MKSLKNCDTLQHSQFLRCFLEVFPYTTRMSDKNITKITSFTSLTRFTKITSFTQSHQFHQMCQDHQLCHVSVEMQNLHCLLCPIPIFFRSLKINLCLPLFHLDTGSITASKLAIHTACQLQISDIGSALEAFLRVAFYRPAVLSQYERVTFCLRGGCCVVQRHLD